MASDDVEIAKMVVDLGARLKRPPTIEECQALAGHAALPCPPD